MRPLIKKKTIFHLHSILVDNVLSFDLLFEYLVFSYFRWTNQANLTNGGQSKALDELAVTFLKVMNRQSICFEGYSIDI